MAQNTFFVKSPLLEAGLVTSGLATGQSARTNPISLLQGRTTAISSTVAGTDNLREIVPVTDVIMPFFMRSIPISFVGYNLRPNRRSYVFFDGKDVSSLIERANIVELDNSVSYASLIKGGERSEYVNINYGIAKVLHSEKNESGNTVLYLSSTILNDAALSNLFSGQITSVQTGNTVSSANSSNISNVVSYQHFSGKVRSGSNSTIIRLSTEASTLDDFYVGNTITVLGSSVPGQTANIVSYNGVSRSAEVSPSFEGVGGGIGLTYSISDRRIPYSSSNSISHYTSTKGYLSGIIHIPDPNLDTTFKFRTGDRVVAITDSSTNQVDEATSYANYIFSAGGLQIERQQISFAPSQVNITTPSGLTGSVTSFDSAINAIETGGNLSSSKRRENASLSQTFYISEIDYKDGIFVPFIDLFFANKGTQPIELQIRPVVNGYPDSTRIIPNAVAVLEPDEVNVSLSPDPNNANTVTRFTFSSPVYLESGKEYAFVLCTNDFDYDLYVSELGEKIIGSDRVVSEQPYVGSMFKSQNARTDTAIQSEDVMFIIHKCRFNTSGSVIFKEKKDPYFKKVYALQDANTRFDSFDYHSDVIQVSNTAIDFSYKSITSSNNTMDLSYTPFRPDITNLLSVRKVIRSDDLPDESFLVKIDMSTNNPDVSPIIYPDRQGLSTVTTIINNMSVDPTRITVANTGNGYTYQNTSVTITSSVGGGANANIITLIEPIKTGKIAGLRFDSFGSDYFEDVNVTISSTDGSNASILVNSELDSSGGPAYSRYVSKTITLTPGVEAGDLRVFLTAVKPPEANIQVYYKVKNFYDNENIDNKRWTRMEQRVGALNFSKDLKPIELEFRPSFSSNNVVYSTDTATFDSFNQFKVKIVMSSSDTVFSKIPYIYDMIAVALPADSG